MNVPVPVICFPFPFPLTSTDCAPENTPENFCQSSIGAGAVYSLFSVKELYSLKAHSYVWDNGNQKLLKIDEKCFLFHFKSSFRSQDI